MASIWAMNATSVSPPLGSGKTKKPMTALPSALGAKNGTQTTTAVDAMQSRLASGVEMSIFIESVLTFRRGIRGGRNVQTAMKHIRHGPKPVRLS